MQRRKKLNLQLKKNFQLWLLLRILGTIVLCSAVAAGILYLYARQEVSGSFYQAHIQIRRVSDLLLPVVAAGSVVSLLSGGLLALFLPQKLAGPLFRIEKDLAEFKDGNLSTQIRLRRNDPLQDFAANINNTMATLGEKIDELQQCQNVLQNAFENNDREAMSKALNQQKNILSQLQT